MNPGRSSSSDRQSTQHRVLVVDDEEVMLRLLALAIRDTSCSCELAGSGEEAVELLGRERFDLAVVDKNLPGIGGLEVARRALDSVPPVPVIMVTGYPSEDSKREASTLGVSSYMTKPFGTYDLRRTVSKVLEDRQDLAEQASASSGADALPHEKPTRPPPGRARIRADLRREIDVSFLILEPNAGIRDELLTVLTGLGLRAFAFETMHQAEIHVRQAGYDVLIARPELLRETRYWTELVAEDAPLGTIAVLDTNALHRRVDATLAGARGLLAPPFDVTHVATEIRRAVTAMRGE
jgi:DNA-binding NtrC family response regulator